MVMPLHCEHIHLRDTEVPDKKTQRNTQRNTQRMVSLALMLSKPLDTVNAEFLRASITKWIWIDNVVYEESKDELCQQPKEAFRTLLCDSKQSVDVRLKPWCTWQASAAFTITLSQTHNIEGLDVSSNLSLDFIFESIISCGYDLAFKCLRQVSLNERNDYYFAPFLHSPVLKELALQGMCMGIAGLGRLDVPRVIET
ncbi:hypothetical protein LTR96_011631 [Exophiala xenobiotica]|nr:hypothetical protein LTR96_011631 [Exophiala xenobiotica]KAK5332252.1 hypothetical protein LTR98_011614 [Exophiala xenobiotica]